MSEKERLVKELGYIVYANYDEDGCPINFKLNYGELADFILSDRRRVLKEIEAILDRSCWVVVDLNGILTKSEAVRLAKEKIHELRKG